MEYIAKKPAYYLKKSWEFNYSQGPNFKGPYPPFPKEKNWTFLGHKVVSPLGIAAGPLPNSKWLITYSKLGYGSLIQKTVRSGAHKCHPFPNVLSVEVKGKLSHSSKTPLTASNNFEKPLARLSITNSFGNPCKEPSSWTKETSKAKKALKPGQLFGVSVYGTQEENTTLDQLAKDYAKVAKLAKKAGADFIEANLACPNVIGSENPFLYKDAQAVAAIAKAIKKEIAKTPLLLKIGYFENQSDLASVLKSAKGYFEGISAINTISKKVVDEKGGQALPGRDVSGVCGYAIKEYGIKMVKDLKKTRASFGGHFEIIGVGGAMTPPDVIDYLKAGADHVHSATAVMFNPYFARDLEKFLEDKKLKDQAVFKSL